MDTIYLSETPSDDNKKARQTLKRLQDVAIGVMAPIEALETNPIANSIGLVSLDTIAETGLPSVPGMVRYTVKITGLESEDSFQLQELSSNERMTTIILETPTGVSRVHASTMHSSYCTIR